MAFFSSTLEELQRVTGCLTEQRLLTVPGVADPASSVEVRFRQPARLRATSPLHGGALDIRLLLAAVPDDRPASGVRAVAYRYTLLDRNGTELLAYHWHPGPILLGPDHPHLHVSAALRPVVVGNERGLLPLDKRHLATGRVTLADVVRMLIEEFGVQPIADDWRRRLEVAASHPA